MKIHDVFPKLKESGYQKTSEADRAYNCVAWAAGVTDSWWEPDPFHIFFWPRGIERRLTLECYVLVFEQLGYQACLDDSLEPGFEKVALYTGTHGRPTHVARQLASGSWTSKLGRLEDIEHPTLEALEGREYGAVAAILKRPISHKR